MKLITASKFRKNLDAFAKQKKLEKDEEAKEEYYNELFQEKVGEIMSEKYCFSGITAIVLSLFGLGIFITITINNVEIGLNIPTMLCVLPVLVSFVITIKLLFNRFEIEEELKNE